MPDRSGSKPRAKFRLAILISHPIQYLAPFFRALNQRAEIDLTVYYCSRYGLDAVFDPGFGCEVKWDIPLLEGYSSKFLPNRSRRPGLSSFLGLINPSIFSELRRQQYDAILVHGYQHATYWMACIAARLTKTPYFLRGDSTLSVPRRPIVKIAKQAVLRPLLHGAAACLYVGIRNRQFYEHYGVSSKRLFFVPHSVDNQFFQQQAQLANFGSSFRHRFGIAADLPLILAAGKLIAKKQPLHLLNAFERLRSSHPCSLVFAGEGEFRLAIEKICTDRSIPDVYITGLLNQTEMPAAYAAADILTLSSASETLGLTTNNETWGLVVNEAMSCGLPIIVTDQVGCAEDLVINGENGYTVPWNDLSALVNALENLIIDANQRRSFGGRSLELIQNYSLEHSVEGIVQASLQTRQR